VLIVVALVSSCVLAAPSINSVSYPSEVGVNALVEVTFNVVPSNGGLFSNEYDPSVISVQAAFKSSQLHTILCFYYHPFSRSGSMGHEVITAAGNPVWKCRFTPTLTGQYTFQITATENTNSTGTSPSLSFSVSASPSSLGFVGISQVDSAYFAYADGSVFFPIGENLCWADDTFYYDMYVAKLAANNATYIRIWISTWMFTIEDQSTKLGNYDAAQNQQWRLDYVINLCAKNNIKVMLCLDYAAEWEGDSWNSNPYNTAIGGVLSTPEALWTSNEAFFYFDRRFRYIASRWGYATNLLAWELWNEVDLTNDFATQLSNVATWHAKSFASLRKYDAFGHPISTSFGSYPGVPEIWKVLDFTMIHDYGASDMAEMAETLVPGIVSQNPGKPTYVAEFGTDWNWTNPALLTNDKKGINMHNAFWGSLVAKAAGGGFSWWWDNIIDPDNQYYHYNGIAKYVHGEDLIQQHYTPVELPTNSSVYADLFVPPTLSWGIKPQYNTFTLYVNGTISPPISYLSQVQYGLSAHPDLRNAPSFLVDYHISGIFYMFVTQASPTGARAQILLDGKVLADKTFPPGAANATLEIEVPAGKHNISIDSVASDWYMVSGFGCSSYTQALQANALVGKTKVLGWAKSRAHTWWLMLHNKAQPEIPDGVVYLDNVCTPNAQVKLEWWNTTSGDVVTTSQLTCTRELTLKVPFIDSTVNFDWAFKLLSS
jgi:hypothetical protein